MKKLLFVAVTALCAGSLFAETAAPTPQNGKKPRMSMAERRAKRDARIAAQGGLIKRPIEGKVIRVMTKTDKVTIPQLEEITKEITHLMGYAVECVDGNAQTSQRTGCLIVLAEQGNTAPTLLIAPEDPWASINVSKLTSDNPNAELFKTRITKEIWRAFGYAMGAANSNMQPCLMRPIYGLKDLDAEKVAILCPEPLSGITMSANRLNIAQSRMCTYKQACEEGWAPAPTNDVQKAVAAAVKAEAIKNPTNPIKIEYDPKAGK